MKTICGVDVCKARLDAHVGPEVSASFANDSRGIAELAGFCRSHGVDLVVMESTGGLERPAYEQLWCAGLPGAIVNARSVRKFAEAMGLLEKTDRIDAGVIAHFAQTKGVVAGEQPSVKATHLKALAARLRQVTADMVVQKQRRSVTSDATALNSLDALIGFLKDQQSQLAAEIAEMIKDDPLWNRLATSLRTVKGVADRTIAYLMAELPELGVYSNKAVAKLVGLAPMADDSGKHTGARHIRGGRAGLRSTLFLVAHIAARFDPDLKDFQNRLLSAGKSKMVARTALAHKLVVRLNAKARDARMELAMKT